MSTLAAPAAPAAAPTSHAVGAAELARRVQIPRRLPAGHDGQPLRHLSHSSYSRFLLCPEDRRRHYPKGERTPPTGDRSCRGGDLTELGGLPPVDPESGCMARYGFLDALSRGPLCSSRRRMVGRRARRDRRDATEVLCVKVGGVVETHRPGSLAAERAEKKMSAFVGRDRLRGYVPASRRVWSRPVVR